MLDEVIDILGYFADWRSDLAARGKDLEVSFFFRALCEKTSMDFDRFYLASNSGSALMQRFFGQGPCEHSFNKPREIKHWTQRARAPQPAWLAPCAWLVGLETVDQRK